MTYLASAMKLSLLTAPRVALLLRYAPSTRQYYDNFAKEPADDLRMSVQRKGLVYSGKLLIVVDG